MYNEPTYPPPPYNTLNQAPQGQPYPPQPLYTISGQPYNTAPYPTNDPPFVPHPSSSFYEPPQPEPKLESDHSFVTSSFNNKSIRHAFIRKVYLILTLQLLVTGIFICVFLFVKPVAVWVARNSWFYYVSYAVFLCTYIALACCAGVRRRFPGNFIALSIFTLSFSYVTATISSYYQIEAVLIAVGITGVLCIAISIFAIQTRIDITKCTVLLFVVSLVFMLTGIVCLICYAVGGSSRILQAVYGGIGALVFSLYLAYDTQTIIGGRKYELSPEEYIFAALQLYMDVVNLFMMLLTLVGSSRD